MLKRNSDWDKRRTRDTGHVTCDTDDGRVRRTLSPVTGSHVLIVLSGLLVGGCATPHYAVRPAPQPDESAAILRVERAISGVQAKQFQQQGARPILRGEQLWGFDVQSIVDRLRHVTERATLPYRALLYPDRDPNAAALADGRVYLSSGMLEYLAQRGSREDELAFVLAHELAHTVAQHLVQRYHTLYRQQALMSIVATGAALVSRGTGRLGQEAGRLALDVASLLSEVAISGYSQQQEFEADQLGIRYVTRAGFDPHAVLDLLQDFSRFESPWPFFRTHPYIAQRREYLRRYLEEWHRLSEPASHEPVRRGVAGERREYLRSVQQAYPVGSVSWKNLQRQIDALNH